MITGLSRSTLVFGKDDVFHPRTTRQYLYRVISQDTLHSTSDGIPKVSNIQWDLFVDTLVHVFCI